MITEIKTIERAPRTYLGFAVSCQKMVPLRNATHFSGDFRRQSEAVIRTEEAFEDKDGRIYCVRKDIRCLSFGFWDNSADLSVRVIAENVRCYIGSRLVVNESKDFSHKSEGCEVHFLSLDSIKTIQYIL